MKALVELWWRLNEGPTSIYGAKMALTLPLFYVRSEHAAVRGEVGSGKLESPVLQPPIIHERTNKSIKLRVLQPRHRYTNTNTNNTNSSYCSCNDYDSACKLPLAASAGGDDTFPLMCLSRPPFVS